MKYKLSAITILLLQTAGLYAANVFPIEIINKTQIAANKDVYVAIKASINGKDCMFKFNAAGLGTCELVNKKTNLSQYNHSLSSIHQPLALAQTVSGRIYFSIKYPMKFYVDPKTNKIVDPDGFNPRDTNYYTLYDKIEYTFNNGGTWMNPTAVDFFSLPISISQRGSTSGATAAGLNVGRKAIIATVDDQFAKYDSTYEKVWSTLKLHYTNTLLRIMSPGKAMVKIPHTQWFPLDYLAAFEGDFNYTDYLWSYYERADITIDCGELQSKIKLNSYKFTGHVEGNDFVFRNQDNSSVVSLAKPINSRPFFAGAGDSFDAENNTPKAIIVRELTSAVEVGLLPAPTGTLLNKDYFKKHKRHYYTDNVLVPNSNAPWYDLYSKALHSFGSGKPIYTFAYDDALGQDGTLHDPSGSAPSKATIVLGDMSKTVIPNPYHDATTYTVMPILGLGSVVVYKGKEIKTNQLIHHVTIPFHITLNGVVMDVYINPQMVIPFSAQSDGLVIDKTSDDTATIIFPSRS